MFRSSSRRVVSADENKAAAQGEHDQLGTYSVSEADGTIAIHIEGTSFRNWNGTDQKRIFTITGDAAHADSSRDPWQGALTCWKRAK